jgi:hypothetical protein
MSTPDGLSSDVCLTSRTTPTMVSHAESPVIRTRRPMGSVPGKSVFAAVSLIVTTRHPSAASLAAIGRPRRMDMPAATVNPSVVRRYATSAGRSGGTTGRPSISRPVVMFPPASGTCVDAPASVTPGRARSIATSR